MAAGASPQQPTPETRRAFERLTNAVRVVDVAIDAFDLSEGSVKNIWNALYALEKLYLKEITASVGPRGSAVRDAVEVEYAASVGVSDPREATVSALLDKWSKRGLDLLSGDSTQEVSKKLESLGVLVTSSDLVFVETDSAPLTRGDGGGTWTRERVEPRLQQLIAHLQLTGIHKDDLVVRVGTVRDDMMRSEPYVIVEIPALSKEVVVCNQVGEITFVSSQRMGPDFYASRTKEQLKATQGIDVVTYHRQEQWLEDVTRLLFRDGEPHKVDVRDREAIRNAVLSIEGMSPAVWVEMSKAERQCFKVPGCGIGFLALARRFDVRGDVIARNDFLLELGERIFGFGTVISDALRIARASPDELRTMIVDGGVTAESWARMTQIERSKFRVPGTNIAVRALATRFGVRGDPRALRDIHLQLGEKIFGLGTVISSERENKPLSVDDIRDALKKGGITAESWLAQDSAERARFRVPGTDMALKALASRFDVSENPYSKLGFLALGERIFGEGIGAKYVEELKSLIKETGVTEREWVRMGTREKISFKVPGTDMGLQALATRLGVTGNPHRGPVVFLELGERIFGEGAVIASALELARASDEMRGWSPEKLTAAITSDGMTAEKWAGMDFKARRAYRVPGSTIGLKALARRFGVTGNPVGRYDDHLELATQIFGAQGVISEKLGTVINSDRVRKLPLEELTAQIKKMVPSADSWVSMTVPVKQAFKVPDSDMGWRSVATRFGIQGCPISSSVFFLELGVKIFGEEPVIVEALRLARNTERVRALPLDEIRDIITSAGYSAITWAAMRQPDRLAFKVPTSNIGIKALARIFGVEGNPINQNEAHCLLGQKLFGKKDRPSSLREPR